MDEMTTKTDRGGRKRTVTTVLKTIVKAVLRRGTDGKKRRELRTTQHHQVTNPSGPSKRPGRSSRNKKRSRRRLA